MADYCVRMCPDQILEMFENLSSEDEDDVLTNLSEKEEVEEDEEIVCSASTAKKRKLDLGDEDHIPNIEAISDDESDSDTDGNEAPEAALEAESADELPNAETFDELLSAESGDYKKKWCKNLENFPNELCFQATPGLQGPLNLPAWNDCRPVDLFRLFVNKHLIKHFRVETNRYARQMIAIKRRSGEVGLPQSSVTTWKPVSHQDMTNFLAILIHMGVVRKPQIADYWSQRPILHSGFPSKIMKRERFRQILSFFHLNDNSTALPKGHPQHDPLHKVRPLLDHLNHLFKTVYIPEQCISIDEASCPWHGRGGFSVYMKDKPIKWGIKLYELCESSSGYVYNLEVMCSQPGVSNRPYDVVLRLMQPLKSLGYILYVDNYYCCPALAHTLSEDNTGLVGTVETNRVGLPKDFMAQSIPKGEADFRRHQNVVVMKWKDRREVSVLTTIHRPQMATVNTTETKIKPTAIIDYNKHMGGVDRSDQSNSYAPLHRKTLKWWKKLAFHLLTLTMTQAHCLYNKIRKQIGERGMPLEKFILSVGEDLVHLPELPDDEITGAARPLTNELHRLTEKHFMEPAPNRNCVVCYARAKAAGASALELKNRRQRTSLQCKQCKKSLCLDPCMELYHTKQDYTK